VQIQKEAQQLGKAGAREITLLGQNVNAYCGEGPDAKPWSLARLIRHLAETTPVERLRYTTSHPRDMTPDLVAAHRDEPKLMPYLHLPVQSGSDKMLKAMNRGHSRDSYLRTVERIRDARPDLALSSDFIVGFPGESDMDFQATLDLVRQVRYAQAFSFKYSARPGTPAAAAENQIPEQVKLERLYVLQALLKEQTNQFNAAARGTVMPVLFDRPGRSPGQAAGRTPYLQAVHVNEAAGFIGEIRDVRISKVLPNSLLGELVRQDVPEVCAH
jgi:tRNA-2-methylthio-N6-dimethylallyladenosine synthase